MLETVTVVDVSKNASSWYEIELEDGRVASTKDKKVADQAHALIGIAAVPADINEKVSGNFTNIYLNGIGGEATTVSKKVAAGKPTATPTNLAEQTRPTGSEKPSVRDSDRQASIQAQWALGRAIELLGSSGMDFVYPLDTDTFQGVQVQAKAFLLAAQELAKS